MNKGYETTKLMAIMAAIAVLLSSVVLLGMGAELKGIIPSMSATYITLTLLVFVMEYIINKNNGVEYGKDNDDT